MKKNYLLYSNKEQHNLLALAESKEQLKEVSLEYTEGVWFEYDVIEKEDHSDTLINEKLYKGKPKFATEPIEKEVVEDKIENHKLHSGIGDLR
jgi:hypothetical protein